MAVLVRNLTGSNYIFNLRGSRTIAADAVALVSEEEWASIADSMRDQPSGIVALWPTINTSDATQTLFDYFSVAGTFEVEFLGTAAPSTLLTDPTWTIKKFSYTTLGGNNLIASIETFSNVAWDDRNSL